MSRFYILINREDKIQEEMMAESSQAHIHKLMIEMELNLGLYKKNMKSLMNRPDKADCKCCTLIFDHQDSSLDCIHKRKDLGLNLDQGN